MDFIENTEIATTPIDAADAKSLAEAIAEVLDSKKARDIKVLYVEDKTVIAEYFVVCTGNSSTQVKALADEVVYQMGLCGVECLRSEGYDTATWILLDFGSIIVHVFQKDARNYFKLEKLWADAEEINIDSIIG